MSEVAATGISVLLVDDHPIVRQGYRRVLESQGDLHVVAEADNAADAYSAFKAHDPDVVVLDISMPGASGLEAIRNIRAQPAGADPRLHHAQRSRAGEGRLRRRSLGLRHQEQRAVRGCARHPQRGTR